MRLVLVPAVPRIQSSIGLFPPIGAISVASTLKSNGFDATIVDVSTLPNWREVLAETVRAPDVVAVGISSYTSASIRLSLDAIEIARKNNPKVPLIWGGYHASACWKEILEEGLVDLVVRATGEIPTLEIMREIARHGVFEKCDFKKIENVAYRTENGAVSNPIKLQLPEDMVPVLDYGLIDIKKYDSMANGRVFAYSSHGCPSRCTFCSEASHTCGKWVCFSAERTVADIQHYIEKYHASRIDYLEANFAANIHRVIDICKRLLRENIKVSISANMRIRDLYQIHQAGEISLLKEAGFDEIFIGVESGSDRILDYLNKGSSRKEILTACNALGEAGIHAKLSWMHDLPTETLEDSALTISLSEELCKYDSMLQVHHFFFPFPHTPIYNEIMGEHTISRQINWEKCAGNTTFGGNSIYPGNQAIRSYVKNEIEALKVKYPKVFKNQSNLIVEPNQ